MSFKLTHVCPGLDREGESHTVDALTVWEAAHKHTTLNSI